ncbi:MAG: class IV adenylate cyclase [Candidatus Pacebacteria bacterium]|nr:class IV adenylate cyclase [Candidatus Paceibacterota bacterium]
MREIEVKARISNMGAMVGKLEEMGCEFSDAVTQEDVVYTEKVGSVAEFLSNSIFLRIREGTKGIVFTLKYNPDRQGEPDAMPIEHEIKVDSRSELEAILTFLGYTPMVTVKKTRRTGHYKNWEICLDEVEELGSFIEVEQMAEHEEDIEPIRAEIMDFLRSLEISEEDMLVKRYDIQMLERQFAAM